MRLSSADGALVVVTLSVVVVWVVVVGEVWGQLWLVELSGHWHV